jgi:hypothetical protein
MKRCIINVSVGGWYPRGQKRLAASVKQHAPFADFIGWNTWPPGSPPHSAQPYGFKSYAFQDAIRRNYETILWLDASCWAIKSLEPLFATIEKEGHVFCNDGHAAGSWLKDEALAAVKTSRDDALKMPCLTGMFLGVCLAHERSRTWLNRWIEVCQDGKSLPPPPGSVRHNVGNVQNIDGCVSADPRCKGHVADQALASIIAFDLGMDLTPPPIWRDFPKKVQDPSTFILAQGM